MKYVAGFVIILGLLVFIYAGSSKYVPIRTSIADSITSMTNQRNANLVQLRRQQQEEWTIDQTERALKLTERQQISSTIVSEWQTVLPWLFGVGSVCICILFFSTTLGITKTTIGISDAAAYRARLVSRQIPLDPETGSFPLLISEDGNYVLDVNNFITMEVKREYTPQLQFVDSANRLRRLAIIGYSTVNQKGGRNEIVMPILEDN